MTLDKIPISKRIGTRIFITLLIVSSISILATGTTIISLSRQSLRENISQRNLQIARRAAGQIAWYVKDSISELEAIAEILAPFSDPWLQDVILENLYLSLEKFKKIYLANKEGVVLADSLLDNSRSHGFDRAALAAGLRGETYLSPVRLSGDNLPYLTISLPMRVRGHLEQTLLAELNLRDIWELVDDIHIGKKGETFLASHDNILIAHPDKMRVLTRAGADEIPHLPLPLSKEGVVLQETFQSGKEILMAYMPVKLINWVVVIKQPVEDAYLPLRVIILRFQFLIAIMLAIAILANTYLLRGFTRPLKQLVKSAKMIADGNLDHSIDIRRMDEIGRLAEEFNEMVRRLKERTLELQDSESKYRLLTESIHDIIFSLDEEGYLTFFSKRALLISGYDREELLNHCLADFLSPESGRRFLKLLRREKKKAAGKSLELEVELIAKEGREIVLELKLVKVADPAGEWHLIGVARDITERKQAEKKLLSYQEQLRSMASQLSLTEARERKQIAADLHNRIGQALVITKIKLGALNDVITSPEHAKTMAETLKLIEQTIKDTRSLIFDLSSPLLYELGFEAAVEQLIEQIREQYGILTKLKSDPEPVPLHIDISVLLFQIVKELLFNVVKHANAKSIIMAVNKNNNKIQVSVEDDGIGFDISKITYQVDRTGGFGFFSIREKLDHIGGTLEIESVPGHGTKVTLAAPLNSNIKTKRRKNE